MGQVCQLVDSVRNLTAGAAWRAGVSKRGVIRSGLSNKLLCLLGKLTELP